jgi:hypothetical protein
MEEEGMATYDRTWHDEVNRGAGTTEPVHQEGRIEIVTSDCDCEECNERDVMTFMYLSVTEASCVYDIGEFIDEELMDAVLALPPRYHA